MWNCGYMKTIQKTKIYSVRTNDLIHTTKITFCDEEFLSMFSLESFYLGTDFCLLPETRVRSTQTHPATARERADLHPDWSECPPMAVQPGLELNGRASPATKLDQSKEWEIHKYLYIIMPPPRRAPEVIYVFRVVKSVRLSVRESR